MAPILDEIEILTRSIGEHAVDGIGRENLRSLSVLFDARDASCSISFVLAENTDGQQLRALDKLLAVQELFIDEASFEFHIGEEADAISEAQSISQHQFSYS